MLVAAFIALLALHSDTCSTIAELRVPTRSGDTLAVELSFGAYAARRPVIIMISGAGPYTRHYSTDAGDSESGNAAFRILRDAITNAGYAVVRYDERGTGGSTGDYAATATTLTLTEDVADIVDAVRLHPAIDPKRIILLGHSEGGAIALRLAARDTSVQGVITLAAPAWSGPRVIDWQRQRLAEIVRRSADSSSLELVLEQFDREHRTRASDDVWYRAFLGEDYAPPMLRQPLLVLQGTRDDYVSPEQAEEIARAATDAGNRRVSLVMLEDHGHGFGPPGGQWYPGKLSDGVVVEVVQWLVREHPISARVDCPFVGTVPRR